MQGIYDDLVSSVSSLIENVRHLLAQQFFAQRSKCALKKLYIFTLY